MNRLTRQPMFRGLLAIMFMALAGKAWALPDAYYINNAIVSFPGTALYPPQIDALNFVNNSSFTVNFGTILLGEELYETSDTLNYTNIGLLMCNSGFWFDDQTAGTGTSSTGGRKPSISFYNSGTVSCGSVNDTTDPLDGELAFFGYAQCLISATNIFNPGILDVGEDGLIQITGKHVDLTHSQLLIEGGPTGIGFSSGVVNVTGTQVFGEYTNWDPGVDLGPNYAYSAPFPILPIQLVLNNSTCYVDPIVAQINGTNIIRAVFIQDSSGPSVNVSVFFDTPFTTGFGNGTATIQWAGSYLDPASGNTYSNYLYLNNDYALGASTNVLIAPVPTPYPNFTFFQSTVPLNLPGQAVPGFPTPSPWVGLATNYYDFGNYQLVATIPTNTIGNQSITNLPGRVELNGGADLNLSFAQINGPYYLSMVSTNQFNGSAGAFIASPYAEISVGVTNGPLYITNILQADIPIWNGTVQAWNTRFFETDTNPADVYYGTNDLRVLIVASDLNDTTLTQVRNLILHDYHSNNIVISDAFNVMNTFYADSQSLTLTTNPIGNGATSLDGELNLESPSILFQSSTPNLRYLTNNGAIRAQNLVYFGYPFETNCGPATNTLLETGTNVVKKDTVTIGSDHYLFVSSLTNKDANQVQIVPSSFDASLSNLIAAINGGPGSGTAYSTNTKPNPDVLAGMLTNFGIYRGFTVTAQTNGASGNKVVTLFAPATKSTNLTWVSRGTLMGGGSNAVPYLFSTALVNNGIFSDQGSIFYAGNFESSGIFSNGIGSFSLLSLNTTLTNCSFYADGDVSITANTLVTSNLMLLAGRSLTLTVTNLLSDGTATNANFWLVGSNSVGSGLNLPVQPVTGDLLNTVVTLFAPTNRNVVNVWAATNDGLSTAGYVNNEAIGQLVLNVANQTPGHTDNGMLTFKGVGVSNALYVDELVLTNFATHGNATNNFNFVSWLTINTNMFIYYARAVELSGGLTADVSENIDYQSQQGANDGRLRWISSYVGPYSATNMLVMEHGVAYHNTYNAALAQSPTIDSDGDGIPNSLDPTPFFMSVEINLNTTTTNQSSGSPLKIQWTTIPNATNFVYFTTNLMSGKWLPFTNFNNWYFGNSVPRANPDHLNSFVSPQVYINNPSLPDNSQQTNVWVFDVITNVPHYYKVVVDPALNFQP